MSVNNHRLRNAWPGPEISLCACEDSVMSAI